MTALLISSLLLLGAFAPTVISVQRSIEVNNDFNVSYEVTLDEESSTKGFIVFDLAVRTKGWVGIGFKDGEENMRGADLFIGGIDSRSSSIPNRTYFGDYHVSENASSTELRQIRDAKNDFFLAPNNNETVVGEDTITYLRLRRYLDTNDTEDVVIQDKGIHFILAYHNESDNSMTSQTQTGIVPNINFLSSSAALLRGIGGIFIFTTVLVTVLRQI